MAWSSSKWAKYSVLELVALEKDASAKGQKQRVEEIRYAITNKLAEKRAVDGDPVPTSGYSGRQSKRRR